MSDERCLCGHTCHRGAEICWNCKHDDNVTLRNHPCETCACFGCQRATMVNDDSGPEEKPDHEGPFWRPPDGYALEVSDEDLHLALHDPKRIRPLLIYVFDRSKRASRKFDAEFQKVANEFRDNFYFLRVDVWENPRIRQQYNVRAYPSTILFVRTRERARWKGGMKADVLGREVLKALGMS